MVLNVTNHYIKVFGFFLGCFSMRMSWSFSCFASSHPRTLVSSLESTLCRRSFTIIHKLWISETSHLTDSIDTVCAQGD